MIFRGLCYRAHDPKWAFAPLSGEGAAIHGGRFNPRGAPALYLALTIEGAITEASHGLAHRLQPLTLCQYEIDCAGIADLRDEAGRMEAAVTLADLAAPWMLDIISAREPASWQMARKLIAAGFAGAIVPSFANKAKPDAANLVLWTWGAALPHKVVLRYDEGRLPKNQRSWE